MTHKVAVLGTFQSEFRTHDPTRTFVEQAQRAAAGALQDAGIEQPHRDAMMAYFERTATFLMNRE